MVLKALAADRQSGETATCVVLGDVGLWRRTQLALKTEVPWRELPDLASLDSGEAGVWVVGAGGPPLPERLIPGAPEAAEAALRWIELGARACLRGDLDGLVTGPLNKEAVIRTGRSFTGQTELLSEIAGVSRTAMMLLGHDAAGRWLRVALATTHLPLRAVADALDPARIAEVIELTVEACGLLGLPRSRVAVCALNPHAGEGGKLGDEEGRCIVPAIHSARSRGLDVAGPLAADTAFHQVWRGDFDAVVAMYHDQGLGPLKMVAFDTGVNWTLGLPFVRTSPDHGTAFGIAGKDMAEPGAMIAAIVRAARVTGVAVVRGTGQRPPARHRPPMWLSVVWRIRRRVLGITVPLLVRPGPRAVRAA